VKFERLYTRTLRSEQAVATMGRLGWGLDCHVREFEGGLSVARGDSVCVRAFIGGGDMAGCCE
jgi:hypothetical protein